MTNAHQGEVSLLSKPGEGAHFCIKIPKLAGEPSQPEFTNNENDVVLSEELSNDHK